MVLWLFLPKNFLGDSRVNVKIFLGFTFLGLFFCGVANALPRYSVQEGVSCYSCHVNPSGSGKRNDTGGRFFSHDLSLEKTKHFVPEDIKSRVAKYFGFGFDLRVHNTTTFASPTTNVFTVPQGSLYAEVNAGQYIAGYVDYDVANTVNREMFVMLSHLPTDLYVKAGRINLPYGLRIDDDTSFIRSNFNMTFSNQDIGAEVGIMPGPFEIMAAVSNGVPGGTGDENLAKAITSSVNFIQKKFRLGTSFHWNKRTATQLLFGGMHAGLQIWKFTWLGEMNLQQQHLLSGAGNTYVVAGYSELNWRVIEGLYVKTIYDVLDPDYSVADNLQHRIALGFDLYPIPDAQVSLLYRLNVGAGAANDDQILVKTHFFF